MSMSYERARDKLNRRLSDSRWHARMTEIEELLPDIPAGWFLRMKQDLNAEHRFFGADGKPFGRGRGSCVKWRIPRSKP